MRNSGVCSDTRHELQGGRLTRREKVLAAAGAKDIEEYTERRGFPPRHQPLPRLVIVIDEFASLVRDLPDFVAGLVGIAQRGRSLGIHLILATQRPSGVVSSHIRANTNLRIALRVTDAAESTDVIDAPDAAQISRATPGRGYVRLAPLPHALLLRDLPAPGSQGRASGPPGAGHAPIPFGLIDLPGRQRQQTAALDPDAFGHLMAAGAPRSGRSQLLRTLAAAATAGHSCADPHLYGLDGGNGALLPLADLPHCGAVVTRTQDERATRSAAAQRAEAARQLIARARDGELVDLAVVSPMDLCVLDSAGPPLLDEAVARVWSRLGGRLRDKTAEAAPAPR